MPRTQASKKTRPASPSSGRRFARPPSRTKEARRPLRKRPSRPKSPKKTAYPKPFYGVLSGKQRRYLRGLAHSLEPSVTLGKGGIALGVTKEIDRALLDHELIKLRFLREFPQPLTEALPLLETELRAQVAGKTGRIVILYRPHPKRPRIVLPRPSAASLDGSDSEPDLLDADSEPDSPED